MKKRLMSAFLAVIMLFSMLSTTAFAASSEEEALGEIDIYNGGVKMSYLSINGRIREQIYTYYNHVTPSGAVKEIPAYCVNPNDKGVPQTVGVGESIQYLADEKAADPKVTGIIANGYPNRGLSELGVENKYHAYYATKMALWCYLLSHWDINNLKVNPNLTGVELKRAQQILAAAKDIYRRGTAWTENLSPNVTCTPDRDVAYEVTINGRQYKQQIFTVTSKTWVCNYKVNVSFTDPDSVPAGTRIVDVDNNDVTTLTTSATGEGYSTQFKVLYPVDSVAGQTGSVQLSFDLDVYQYAIFYASVAEVDKYGNIQNYMVDTDPTRRMELSAYSNYGDEPEAEMDTGLQIVKYEAGTTIPLSGAMFEVVGPDGATVGTFATNASGKIRVPLTLTGNYTVYERVAPDFYLLSAEPAQNVQVVYGEVAEVVFENEPYGNLRIEKTSDTGMNLPGAMVTITHIESGKSYTGETNSAGVAVFSEIKPGAYRIQEKAAPSGWLLDATIYTTNVVAGETTTFHLVNEELPGLRIIKYDRKNMVAMPDVTFEVWRDGVSLGTFRTDEFGEILLTDVDPGTYRAVEVDTGSDGHILNTTPQEVELEAGDGIKELMFFNDVKPGLRLVKVDSTDPSKVIPNALFEIKSVAGDYGPEEFRTDQNGEIDLSKLPTGAYVVTEKSCPGYVIDDAQRIIQLDPNEDAHFVFTNSIKPSLQIIKLSSDGSPLKGVSFRIAKIEDGTHYLDRTTNQSGEILIGDMEPGVYSVRETATLSDHIIDLREYKVELFPGKTSTLVIENQIRPNLYVYKHDADTGEPIPDTVFIVRAADGHSVDELRTGADGRAELKNLLPGVYEISEKSVPSPYLLDAPSQLVTLYPNRDHTVYFENHQKPSLTVNKICSVTGDPLKGAKFHVTYASNETESGEINDLGCFYSDETGQFKLSNLKDGWYKITEVESVPGYSVKEPATQEVFIKAGESKTLTFENTPLSALVVYKYDSVTGEAIKNAVFQVKYLTGTSGTGGTVIGTYKSSANGSFTVTGLKAGTYIVEELASDSGHVIDTAPQTAYISGKEQDVVELYFGNSPKGALLVKKIDSVTREPLSDVEFFVTTSDGTVVGNGNGKFITDSAGTFLIENIAPGTTLVVKETRAKDGYVLDDTPQTARIQAGQTVTLEFRNQPKGSLIIHKLDSVTKKPLEGVQFKITYADGLVVDADGGQLSYNGLYWTDKSGQIKITGITGTVVATEVQTIDGYTIHEETRSQTVAVNANDTQSLYFYNDPVGGLELVKVNADKKSERIPDTIFEIRRMDDGLIDTVATDSNGRAFVPLENGSYYAVETKSADGFELDSKPHYFEVKDGKITTVTVENKSLSGILIHKIDSTTGDGIYGAAFLLYDSNKKPIGQYESDQDGWVYITDLTESGRYYIRELENEGYNVDTQMKTVYVRAGKTVEIEWENEPITGQIQIYKYAAEYNSITGTAPGTPLKGAVYEIVNARSGKVVDYITTDARGVAASKPLPLTRYQIREVTAPAYWQVDTTVHDVTLEYAGQIIKLSAYDKPANLGVSITKRGNAAVLAGSSMRYDFTLANTSNVDLESFYFHDRIPTDVARATVLTTGTYNARLNYRILYKTNYTGSYQVLASNLLTSNNYSFALNAIPMQVGEVVTDVYFDFGKVPVGFQSVAGPTLSVQVLGTAVNGYQMVNRADVGGKYQGAWQTAQANWVTVVQRFWNTPNLPKTGY
ncbi:Predicted outer membrane protein [uncultured Flavonifractor sp.]|nr:collagen adhesin [Flavonifractor plautii]SCJ47483.1 Predicted outer membrane protein [uncultured Flavonifractor sp.]